MKNERERKDRERRKLIQKTNKQTNRQKGEGGGGVDWRQKIQKIEMRYRRDCLCTRARNK